MSRLARRVGTAVVAVLAVLLPTTLFAAPAQAVTHYCDTYYVDYFKWLVPDYSGSGANSVDCRMVVGSTGAGVEVLQNALITCYGRDIASDGVFGAQTKAALQYAQKKAGISADGVYGPQTRDHIKLVRVFGGVVSCGVRG